MALVFPRAMLCGASSVEFEIARAMAMNRLNGGVTQVRELGEPRWRASYTYAPLKPAPYQALQAWLDSLRGGLRIFLGHDPLKPFPVAYRGGFAGLVRAVGGAPFDGGCEILSLAPPDQIDLESLPAGFALTAGDMVGLAQGATRALYRVIEDATASAGGIVTLTIEPRIVPGLFTSAAAASFVRPACLMSLDPATIAASRSARKPGSISFSGIQKIF